MHGDAAGIEGSRRALTDWLDWTWASIDAGAQAQLDRYIGYYEPYATSHDALDQDEAVQEETRNAARAVAQVTAALRAGEPRRRHRGTPFASAQVDGFAIEMSAPSAPARQRVISVCCTAAKSLPKVVLKNPFLRRSWPPGA